MQSSKPEASYLRVILVCGAITTLAACASTGQHLASVGDRVSNTSSTTQLASNPSQTAKAGNPTEQFTAIIGSKADGWLPKVLAGKGLKAGLTPSQTAQIIPGADKVSEFGYSKVVVNNIPGLKQYEFYYDKASGSLKLTSVRLMFDPTLNEAYNDLVQVAAAKYGQPKPEEVQKQIISWVGPEFVTAQLTKQVTDFGGYELNVYFEAQ